ncbi:MAG: AAA family ATPase [bacterium]
MKLKYIEWQNIKSYGNKIQRLEFPNEGGLTSVVAKNGFGKTTLLDLPKLLYYGKLEDFKKEEIANRLNRHGWIKGEVEISPNNSVIIERTFSPTNLYIYKKNDDGELVDIGKAGINNYQEYIDTEVTGLPYNIFSNIISLSINDFKSFISMSPHDKRIIIDKLFSMGVLNSMYELVKKDLKEIKDNINLFNTEIESLESNIKNASKELDTLKQNTNDDNKKRIEDIKKQMKDYKEKYNNTKNKLDKYLKKQKEIQESYNIFIQQKSNLNSEINSLNKKIHLYNKDKCPTCSADFNSKEFKLLKEDLNNQIQKRKKKLTEIKDSESKYKESFNKIQEGIDTLNKYLFRLKSTFDTLNQELKKLNHYESKEFQSIRNIISKNSEKKKQKQEEKESYDDNYKYLAILNDLYSDEGVKKKIMESYLPTLNKEIEYTLNELHFPYKLRFNNSFEPELRHLGIDINVKTLSTGEKKKVDLAVLVSIVRMLKRKFPNLNTFMLDEVLSSVDGDGLYDIIGLLKKTSKDMNIHIFIVSHTVLPVEYFDRKILINKNDGFSDIEVADI